MTSDNIPSSYLNIVNFIFRSKILRGVFQSKKKKQILDKYSLLAYNLFELKVSLG